MCTNHIHTIKLDKQDARYFVLECNPSKKNDRLYFDTLDKCFTQESANHFVKYLIDYDKYVDIRYIPMTKLKQDMIDAQKDSIEQYIDMIHELIENKTIEDELHIDEYGRVSSSSMYEHYVRFAEKNGEKPYTQTRFGVRISSTFKKIRSNGSFYKVL